MKAVIARLVELLRPSGAVPSSAFRTSMSGGRPPSRDADTRVDADAGLHADAGVDRDVGIVPENDSIRTLTTDLLLALSGLAFFGVWITSDVSVAWRLWIALKIAGVFLATFVLSLAPIYALKRLFDVEARFGDLVSVIAAHFALVGVFASVAVGPFLLLRRGHADADGALAIAFLAASVLGSIVVRARAPRRWFTWRLTAVAVVLTVALLGQSAWALRPYMNPTHPTLFQARLEWFTGSNRRTAEDVILRLAGRGGARPERIQGSEAVDLPAPSASSVCNGQPEVLEQAQSVGLGG
ncbi:MAG: hypothetical protein IPK13_02435 [Deltaproteobacteria bacterium]|nr:hypothetical protein [Deltaproteobacteria bacterium]